MPAKLYIVHGSHPCDAVAKALELKGIAYKTVEIPPPFHAVVMPRMFAGRTVPGIKFEDGEKVHGSGPIMRRLDELAPEPRLYGDDPRIEEAERWGDDVLQPIARRLLWPAFGRAPAAMYDFQAGQKSPKLPRPVIRLMAPFVVGRERKLNDATDEAARADLRNLPGHLDKIDAWIAEGVLGGEQPNAADLQIATTLRLLWTLEDVRPLIAGRPAADLAHRWYEPLPGSIPAGTLPAEWLPDAGRSASAATPVG